MKASRIALVIAPFVLMVLITMGLGGIEQWLVSFGKTEAARRLLGRAGVTLPYILAAGSGTAFLFAGAGSGQIRWVGWVSSQGRSPSYRSQPCAPHCISSALRHRRYDKRRFYPNRLQA
jgi:hypothetical protein